MKQASTSTSERMGGGSYSRQGGAKVVKGEWNDEEGIYQVEIRHSDGNTEGITGTFFCRIDPAELRRDPQEMLGPTDDRLLAFIVRTGPSVTFCTCGVI